MCALVLASLARELDSLDPIGIALDVLLEIRKAGNGARKDHFDRFCSSIANGVKSMYLAVIVGHTLSPFLQPLWATIRSSLYCDCFWFGCDTASNLLSHY